VGDDEKARAWTTQAEVIIDHPTGLHARPAITFTKLAKSFPAADIQIRGGDDGSWIDAKSIVKVMGLKLKRGTMLHLRAQGDEADEATSTLTDLVKRNFDEAIES